jgi:hypothetical protein
MLKAKLYYFGCPLFDPSRARDGSHASQNGIFLMMRPGTVVPTMPIREKRLVQVPDHAINHWAENGKGRGERRKFARRFLQTKVLLLLKSPGERHVLE